MATSSMEKSLYAAPLGIEEEMDGMADIEMRRHDPDDEFAKILWEEWEWSREIGQPDL